MIDGLHGAAHRGSLSQRTEAVIQIPLAGGRSLERGHRPKALLLPWDDLSARFVDNAALHHELHMLEDRDVGKRVTVDCHKVGIAALLHTADVLLIPDEIGGRGRRSHDGVDRLHARFDH